MVSRLRIVLAALCFASAAWAQQPGIDGAWTVRLNMPDGARDATMTLTKTGEVLAGTLKGEGGEYGVRGTQKGPAVSVTLTPSGSKAPAFTLTGTLDGDSISGPATSGVATGTWSAKRAAQAKATAAASLDLTGEWAFEVTSPVGKGTPTVVFKQSGESLTGTYTGQMGAVPLTGTLKGSVLSFTTDMTVGTLKLHIVYTGTATQDGVKGATKYGDLGDGAFAGRRK